MAQRVITQFVSDLSGDEIKDGGDSIKFSYRGIDYTIDLTPKEAAGFDKAIGMYVEHAQRVGGRRSSGTSSRGAKTDRSQLQAMREWARKNGYDVSDRGRISQEIQDAYHKAN